MVAMIQPFLSKQMCERMVATALGAIFPLGFAPFEYIAVAPICLGALFWLWDSADARTGTILGFCFGCGVFAVGVSWVFISLHNYGEMPLFVSIFVVIVFVALLSLYPAVCGLAQARFCYLPRALRMLLLMPALWILLEWLRGELFGGFPWLYLGYGQVDSPLAAVAPFSGVLGVSLLAAIGGATLVLGLIGRSSERLLAIGVLILVFGVGFLADRASFTIPDGDPVEIAVIQNNVSLSDKWDPEKMEEIVGDYFESSASAIDADLIVWPEAAIPAFFDQLSTIAIRQLLEHPADYLIGIVERQTKENGVAYYNSAVGISKNLAFYRKKHLVIFGEYLPAPFFFRWLLNYLNIPMSDFSSWKGKQDPMVLAGHNVGITICYEDAFQDRVGASLPTATILINISEDAWFGDSIAPWQRLQIARMRAMEVHRPIVRSNNNGLSALIDDHGEIISIAPIFESEVLRGQLQPMSGITPFSQFGNLPLLVCLSLLVFLCLAMSEILKRKPKESRS